MLIRYILVLLAVSIVSPTSAESQLTPAEFATQFRENLEHSFGLDIGAVRVHLGQESATACAAVNAPAVATGTKVAFKEGEFAVASGSVLELLGHELTHLLQSRPQCPKITEPVPVK